MPSSSNQIEDLPPEITPAEIANTVVLHKERLPELEGWEVYMPKYGSSTYSIYKVEPPDPDDTETEVYYEIPKTGWSEGHKDSMFMSNNRSILRDFGKWVEDISTNNYENVIVISKAVVLTMPRSEFEKIREIGDSLLTEYPVYDEMDYSMIQSELQDEAWENFYRKEFRDHLETRIIDYLGEHLPEDEDLEAAEEQVSNMLDNNDFVDGIYFRLSEHSSGDEWSEQGDGDWNLNVEGILDAKTYQWSNGQIVSSRDVLDDILKEILIEVSAAARRYLDPRQQEFGFVQNLAAEAVEMLLNHPIPAREVSPSLQEAAKLTAASLMESHDYSCVLLPLPKELADQVKGWARANLRETDIFVDEHTEGFEDDPHITVKYGLMEPLPNENLLQVFKSTAPFDITLLPVSLFRSKNYDVVKLGVSSPQLLELNRRVCEVAPYHDTFPEYIPHVTLAYVKKGMGDRLEGLSPFDDPVQMGKTGIGKEGVFKAEMVVFSSSLDHKKAYKLGGRKVQEASMNHPDPMPEMLPVEKQIELDRKRREEADKEPEELSGLDPAALVAKSNILAQPSSLRKMRRDVGKRFIKAVFISKNPDGGGELVIRFAKRHVIPGAEDYYTMLRGQEGPLVYRVDFASYGVLKMAVRQWRNLEGAQLYVNRQPAGKVSYRNPALQDQPGE